MRHSQEVESRKGTQTTAIHLVVKWNPAHAADTIERHMEVTSSEGAVWWGIVSSNNAQNVGAAVHTQLLNQLADGGAQVWLSGPTHLPAWKTDLLEISESRPKEEALIPSYYPKNMAHKIWLKLKHFDRIERDWMMRHLEGGWRQAIAADYIVVHRQGGAARVHPHSVSSPPREGPLA